MERVVLLDQCGRPAGTAPKRSVHTADTPLHLGFSCYVVDRQGRVLLTRRAEDKPTWPGVWTNACCGHPAAGESLRSAVTRRLRDELGVGPRRMALAIADFTYRATMDNGIVEHELCPVVVAEVDDEPTLNLREVSDVSWTTWPELRDRARSDAGTLSPWSVAQISILDRRVGTPARCLDRDADAAILDTTTWISAPRPVAPDAPASGPLDPVRPAVDAVLGRFLDERRLELVAIDSSLGCLAGEIEGLITAGGKRLRPAFVYWGHRAAGSDNEQAVIAVGAAIEMLHTFALLHDDVMDHAETRRGRPSAPCSFAAIHAADHGGDPTRFGTNAAILAGDLAFSWSDDLFDGAPLDPVAARRARHVLATLRTEVMAGQYLDLRLDGAGDIGAEDALRVAVLKSGRYTVRRPLELGLAMSDTTDRRVSDALAAYGDAVGLAFQMRDDVLDLFSDAERTGKRGLSDLRTGKRTVLIARALALATPGQRATLTAALGDRDLSPERGDACREIIADTGALASVETTIRAQLAVAAAAVEVVADPVRESLRALAEVAAERDH